MFVNGFSLITSPLNILSRKSVKFEWPEACEKIFQLLNDKLTSTMVLTLPEGTKVFVVCYGACRVGLDCVLMQHCKLIAYSSRKLKVHEKNYKLMILN